jgi:hypothetical protein
LLSIHRHQNGKGIFDATGLGGEERERERKRKRERRRRRWIVVRIF